MMEPLPVTSSAVAVPKVTEPAAARSRSEEMKRERGEEVRERRRGDKDNDLRKFKVLRRKRKRRGEKNL